MSDLQTSVSRVLLNLIPYDFDKTLFYDTRRGKCDKNSGILWASPVNICNYCVVIKNKTHFRVIIVQYPDGPDPQLGGSFVYSRDEFEDMELSHNFELR